MIVKTKLHLQFYKILKHVGARQVWALEWAWHLAGANLRCPKSQRLYGRLVILIKNIYTLWSRKRFLLYVSYFSTNLVYPFTLRETDMK